MLLDTSAAMHLVDPDSPVHQAVLLATEGRKLGLAGHAAFELLSMLTRLPVPKRLSGDAAERLISWNFPESRFLDAAICSQLLVDFAGAGIVGGAVYDGLVGAAAKQHGLTLVTCDVRARATYDALTVCYRLIG
ncbi:MAG: type II toxin-antitoxin system VapC family toxin [Bifidobacteriaceae bacterium]|nr:type II toxin-antitoxin system VapC family toxin [Bifidobacteriaceae bacterium]